MRFQCHRGRNIDCLIKVSVSSWLIYASTIVICLLDMQSMNPQLTCTRYFFVFLPRGNHIYCEFKVSRVIVMQVKLFI